MQGNWVNLSAADRAVIVAALMNSSEQARAEAETIDRQPGGNATKEYKRAVGWALHAHRLADSIDQAGAVSLAPMYSAPVLRDGGAQ